ncbi:MAG TPA: hypothetical protein VJT16_06965 [Streptosporangiaceae bacterium]|jgi:NTP pyrophosphatase (non-canonical NTP hydrolase)|nr:hypothetical protein [Streptosporangiaceae bacterium]
MEHDTGSDRDPAAPKEPDELSSAQSPEAAEAGEVAEAAESGETSGPIEPASAEVGATAEAAAGLSESREALTTTGEPRVDAVLGRLGELDELPVSEHPGVYERIHEQLVDVLGELHHGPQNS